MNNAAKVINILLVEDNYGDVLLTKEAFKSAKMANQFSVARDGEVALDMLHRRGEYADQALPDLIFLDLNIPKKDGKEVLEEIKNSADLKHIPVIILTSSAAERDVVEGYQLHANSYIIKPLSLEKFVEVAKSIENFWFSLVVLPPSIDSHA